MFCPRCHRTYPVGETHCLYDREPLTDGRRVDFIRAGRTRHIGAILGNRFQIRGFMGQGDSARVYAAEDLRTEEPVALKILEPPWAHDKVAQERFLHEARATSAIDHQGVVRVHFVGQRGDGTPYLAMEYLFGESLASYLQRSNAMDPDVGLPVLREVAVAVDTAHARGIIHRDLKPQNVFLLGEPGDPYGVKVTDFGFAKLRDATITAAGTAVGSAAFMAPEQCVADTVDERTDVYGLGVVAYRMFTGELPFGATPTEEVLAKQLIAPCPLSQSAKPIEPNIRHFIEKCMRKNPANRYENMVTLVQDLDEMLEGRDPLASRHSVPDDQYEPQGPFSRLVARALYRKLGVPVPTSLA